MEPERFKYLYRLYIDETYSDAELEELELFINNPENEEELIRLLDSTWEDVKGGTLEQVPHGADDSIFQRIVSGKQKKFGISWQRIAVAAMFVLCTAAGLFYAASKYGVDKPNEQFAKLKSEDIHPAGKNAVLVLADGKKIELNAAANGKLVSEADVDIEKVGNGELVYSGPANNPEKSLQYNILTIPSGGHYQITLPDGSKVWLNAESFLKFPVSFAANERTVEMSGEAYFEIAKDSKRPFNLKVNGLKVMVLGTHFNVRAYDREGEVKTTLLEGSVRVKSELADALLLPGQQAKYSPADRQIFVSEGNIEAAIGWKNGYFHFNRGNIREIIGEFSRWYNVEVIYEGHIPNDEFVGKIRRSVTLGQALNMLSKLCDFQFEIEGRTIIVKNKM